MRIKWGCPPTNKELIDDYISDYLMCKHTTSVDLKYSEIIANINKIIRKYERNRSVYMGIDLTDHDIRKLYLLRKSLCKNMRIKYIERCIEEIAAV
jgi:hypothetical protein